MACHQGHQGHQGHDSSCTHLLKLNKILTDNLYNIVIIVITHGR